MTGLEPTLFCSTDRRLYPLSSSARFSERLRHDHSKLSLRRSIGGDRETRTLNNLLLRQARLPLRHVTGRGNGEN